MNGRGRARDETGAYLILYAMLASALFTVAAIVLDLAALRQGRRADRTTADLAASAGASAIDTAESVTFGQACERAWGYFLANRTEAQGAITAPACLSTFPAGVDCTDTLGARTATASVGSIQVEITHPVPDASPLMAAETQGGDQPQSVVAGDGAPCDRLGVRIVRSRQFLFGQIAGSTGGRTDVHSVARPVVGTSTEVPAIVAVERTGCDGIATAATSGELRVAGVGQPGIAIVDSDGSTCAQPDFTINPRSPGKFHALSSGTAPGLITTFASGPRAYSSAAVQEGRLSPAPTRVDRRTGRVPIELRYNCSGAGCPAGSDWIDQLEAQLGGSATPAGFTRYVGCTVQPGPPLLLSGNTYIDSSACPFGRLEVSGKLTFSGDAVVFSGGVAVRAPQGCLAVNSPDCDVPGTPARDGVMFVRGSLEKEPASRLLLPQTFVYTGGGVDFPLYSPPGGSELRWSAPLGGRFNDLLLWTESASVRLAEQGSTFLQGTAYAPNGTVVLERRTPGGSLTVPLQVVANRVRLDGPGVVVLNPTADRATGRLTRKTRLIR